MNIETTVLLEHRLLKHAVIQQTLNKGDGTQLPDQGRIEADLIHTVLNLASPFRDAIPTNGVQHHQQHIARRSGIDKRKQAGVAHESAIPIGLAINFHSLEGLRQAGRGEHSIERDIAILENSDVTGLNIGRRQKQLDAGIIHFRKVDHVLHDIPQWVDVERIEIVRAGEALYRTGVSEGDGAERTIGRQAAARAGNAAPQRFQRILRALSPVFRHTSRQRHRIHGPSRSCRNRRNLQ